MMDTNPQLEAIGSGVSGWTPAAVVGAAMALSLLVTPWGVLRAAGLSIPGMMLVTVHLLLGFCVLVLAQRVGSRAPVRSNLTVVTLALAASAFAAVTDASHALAFSLKWQDVQALSTARAVVGGAAVFGLAACLAGAIRHGGWRRRLELALGAQCALVLASASMWQPMADLAYPMAPALAAVPI